MVPASLETADVYIDTAAGFGAVAANANDQFLVACRGAATTSFAGLQIAVAKESLGGSTNGVVNVARQLPLPFLDPDAPACSGPTLPVPASGAIQAYSLHTGCSGRVLQPPDAGISDVDPRLLPAVTSSDTALLLIKPLFQVMFAPAVSLNLYRALQIAQGLPQNDDPANVPNITRGQLEAIFAGIIIDWSEFYDYSVGPFATGPTAPSGFGGAVTSIFVCRRGELSGAQAAFSGFALNASCNASVPAFINPTTISCLADGCRWSSATFGVDFVFAGDGSADVRACLDAKDDLGVYGIGVLSTAMFVNNVERELRFVGVDGAPPTLSAAANGGYHFVRESLVTVPVSEGGPEDVARDVFSFIVATIGEPATIALLNVSTQNPGGDHGILASSDGVTVLANVPPVSSATMRTNPVSSYTQQASGAVNSCQPVSAVADGQPIGGFQ